MDTRAAYYLALLLAAVVLGDLLLNGGDGLLFMARKFLDLMDWVEFWR